MRFLLPLVFIAALCGCAHAPATPTDTAATDAALAQRLGGDERGMRLYMLVMLRTGPYTPQSDEERSTLFQGHFANINRLADEGKMLTAGPLDDADGVYRGIFILDAASVEEARAMIAADPTVASGVFEAQILPWYGSAAMMEVPNIHRRITPQRP